MRTKRDVHAYLVIYDCVGNVVFKDNYYISANTNNNQIIFYTWNLTNNYGRKISGGTYLAVLKTRDPDSGNIEVYKRMIGVKDY